MKAIINTPRAMAMEPSLCEPESDELADSIGEAIRLCDHYTGRAERALQVGDTRAAQDLLRSAINELEEVATMESAT